MFTCLEVWRLTSSIVRTKIQGYSHICVTVAPPFSKKLPFLWQLRLSALEEKKKKQSSITCISPLPSFHWDLGLHCDSSSSPNPNQFPSEISS